MAETVVGRKATSCCFLTFDGFIHKHYLGVYNFTMEDDSVAFNVGFKRVWNVNESCDLKLRFKLFTKIPKFEYRLQKMH